jgi:ATP adenylyltransferase/5',5'''-P-1,P-4-tetraphosphate phosphorylase II
MGTHRYKITINAAPQKPITYTYKYDKTEGIELKISKQKVAVSFQMTTKKEHDDIISFRVRLVKDALRKAHLRNKSNEYFGMPFTQYLRSIGLIK